MGTEKYRDSFYKSLGDLTVSIDTFENKKRTSSTILGKDLATVEVSALFKKWKESASLAQFEKDLGRVEKKVGENIKTAISKRVKKDKKDEKDKDALLADERMRRTSLPNAHRDSLDGVPEEKVVE